MRKDKTKIKILTEHWGELDPFKIGNYLNDGGYEALEKFIQEMSSGKAIEEVKKSKLCGRGGAGFLTGEKWEKVAKQKGTKYFICNLDESEPGTYKDRMIVDNNPHLLLEGIIISSLAIGAEKAYIYINGNYKKQTEILENALIQAESKKYLGQNILGSKYNLEIEIFSGAGAYICGEETALINSIEGNRGEPKIRPPYPTESGLFGWPTVVNNAETIANVAWIILNGGEKYAAIGNPNSPGTKLFLLGGAVRRPGIYERPTGITARDLIFEVGGGLVEGKEFWFAQIGGVCGKLLLENELDMELNYGELNVGADLVSAQKGQTQGLSLQMGAGSILIVDKSVNIFDLLVSWTEFFRRESCGKCVPCREGTFRLYEIMQRFRDGQIVERDKEAIRDILWTLQNTTFCPFGKFASTAVRDAVEKLKILEK